MDVLAKFGQVAQGGNEIGAKTDRMRRGEAKTFEPIDRVNRFEQLHEWTLTETGVSAPIDSVDRWELVAPIEVHDLSQERDLFHPAIDQFPHFPDHLRDRAAALGPARPRNDAKCAMHVAALHDGNKGGRLLRPQSVFADRFLRAGFLRRIDDGKARVVHGAAGIADPGYKTFSRQQIVHVIRHPMKFLRANDEIGDDAFHQIEEELDRLDIGIASERA